MPIVKPNLTFVAGAAGEPDSELIESRLLAGILTTSEEVQSVSGLVI